MGGVSLRRSSFLNLGVGRTGSGKRMVFVRLSYAFVLIFNSDTYVWNNSKERQLEPRTVGGRYPTPSDGRSNRDSIGALLCVPFASSSRVIMAEND